MKNEISEVLGRRLFLVKSLFEHGKEHSYSQNGVDKMIAAHNFHNSIELLLRTILSEKGVLKKKFITFNQMIEEVKKLEEEIAENSEISYGELFTLNELRNLVQHTGKEPSASDLEQWRVVTNQFHKKAFSFFFNCDFEDYSALELIREKLVRNLLINSRKEFSIFEGHMETPVMSDEEVLLYGDVDEVLRPWNIALMRAYAFLGIAFAIVYSKAVIALDDYTWWQSPTVEGAPINSIDDQNGIKMYKETILAMENDILEKKISYLEADLRLRNLNVNPVAFWTFNLFLPRILINSENQILIEFVDQGPPDFKEVFEQSYSLVYQLVTNWQAMTNYQNETNHKGVLSSLAKRVMFEDIVYFEADFEFENREMDFIFDLGKIIRGGFVFH